jgi:hypothetical protein
MEPRLDIMGRDISHEMGESEFVPDRLRPLYPPWMFCITHLLVDRFTDGCRCVAALLTLAPPLLYLTSTLSSWLAHLDHLSRFDIKTGLLYTHPL